MKAVVNSTSMDPDVPMEITVVETTRRGRGRPLKFDVARFLRICGWIQEGKTNYEACQIEDVDYSRFRHHLRLKPRWQKRYEHADKVRDGYMRDFHIANIMRHAPKNVIASLWWLERKYPSSFALRSVSRPTDTNSEKPLYAPLTKEQLLESIRASEAAEAMAPKGYIRPAILDA
jgi:hypothetical protein